MSELDFTALTTPRRLDETRFEMNVAPGWLQGRGAFGGVVVANLVRAITEFEGDSTRSLRSLTAEICGPVPLGPSPIRVERLRAGSAVSTIAGRIEGEGGVLAHAVAVLGKPRSYDRDFCDIETPPIDDWRSLPVAPVAAPLSPEFASNFEWRFTGALPFSGSAHATSAGWIRAKNPGPARDAAYIAALADVFWPSILSIWTAPRPIGTIAFTLEIITPFDALTDPDAPLLHKGHVITTRGGYMVEMRELWSHDGKLVALNQQTIAIIK
jgi:acyl-CoA thioesterase